MYQNQYGYGGYGYGQQSAWQRAPLQPPTAPVYTGEIIKVNGEAGARALRLTPNSSVLALDTTAPLVWVCQADGAGYFTPEPFTLSPYQAEAQKNPLEERIRVLEERMEAMMNEQSDPVHAGARRRRHAEPAEWSDGDDHAACAKQG